MDAAASSRCRCKRINLSVTINPAYAGSLTQNDFCRFFELPIKDRDGRTVAEIYQGSANVNLQMVKLGDAFAYRKYLKQCDSDAYLSTETAAMNRKLGVWGPYKVDLMP